MKRNKRKVNFEYDINYKKELEMKRDQKLGNIYGKLKLLNQSKPNNFNGKKIHINLQLN